MSTYQFKYLDGRVENMEGRNKKHAYSKMKKPSFTFRTKDEAILSAEEMTILNEKPFIIRRL